MKTRIISTLLAVLMLMSCLVSLGTVSVSAASLTEEEAKIDAKYLQDNIYKTPDEKIHGIINDDGTRKEGTGMTLMMEKNGYRFYVDPVSGEVALEEVATSNYLFSNPYDVASSTGSDYFKTKSSTGTKEQLLLSQIIIQYSENDVSKSLYSFQDAAMRGQIDVSKIKNGVRVEYIIGQEAFRKLVPRWIPADSFDENIKAPLDAALKKGTLSQFEYGKFFSYYELQDPDAQTVQSVKDSIIQSYPICEKMPIYVFAEDASATEINLVEKLMKTYCSDTYSFEQMDADHEITGYEADDDSSPVFKLALEYFLNENGLEVRLACSGLQYDMSAYTLEDISILPYMGAGNTKNDGYNFYPDGSGSLFDFNLGKNTTIRGKIYGVDYAYHQLSGTYQKSIRYPVYGTVATETIYTYSYTEEVEGKAPVAYTKQVSNTVMTKKQIEDFLAKDGITQTAPIAENTYKRGYVAIIESGESLGEIETYYAGALSDYATMSNHFNPVPKDSYDIADSISVTSSSTWTVVSSRKYTGVIKIQYQMLCDEKIGTAKKAEDAGYTFFDATWLGMAEAYRAYLIRKGTLQKISDADVKADIPLYIESFGTLETQQTIATVPVKVMTPLTTFEDVQTMYGELAKEGVKNINFKLTGYANGGMYSTIPSDLDWEDAVGGDKGFKNLIAYSEKVSKDDANSALGIYPDFDFAYCTENELFDALNLKKDAIRTIDNRYTSKRQYSATQQKYVSFYQLAISPARYSKFYEKFMKNYDKFGLKNLSVASLGNSLNSDFDEDDPYNREDNKSYTVKAFDDLEEAGYSLMTEGGNAYTWAYIDHLLNVDLDSSRYVKSCASVPFLGAVLHGYIRFAGTPLNEEGDTDYAVLKAVENGAGLYFILSYQNTSELKEDEELSQYYSIRYDIWKDDVVDFYNTLNGLLKDVQTKTVISHEFLNYNEINKTVRILDADEMQDAVKKELEKSAKQAQEALENERIQTATAIAQARLTLKNANATLAENEASLEKLYTAFKASKSAIETAITTVSDLTEEDDDTVAEAVKSLEENEIALWNTYEKILFNLESIGCIPTARENFESLKELFTEDLQLVKEAKQGTALNYQYEDALSQYNAAMLQIDAIKSAFDTFAATAFNSAAYSVSAQTAPEALVTAYITAVNAAIATYNTGYSSEAETSALTLEKVKEDGKYTAPVEIENATDNEAEEVNPYAVTNNRVVAVTYGENNGGAKTAYKTFLLNYNNYAVSVTYEGVIYSIESYGYIVIYR